MTTTSQPQASEPQNAALWQPAQQDLDRPASSRVQEALLGGDAHTWALDRILAEQITAALRRAPAITATHRKFRTRAIDTALTHGLRQFIDIGTGIPTHQPIHELIADHGAAHVVYVDNDPLAVHGTRLILDDVTGGEPPSHVDVQIGDFFYPATILGGSQVSESIDLREPVCLVLTGLLEYCPNWRDPAAVVEHYRTQLAPGSFIILTHPTVDGLDLGDARHAQLASDAHRAAACYDVTATPMVLRGRAEFESLTAELDLVGGGVAYTASWPDPGDVRAAADSLCLAAVGVVP
ncbi:SAM-dependent methyltransferase [Amycolatopsis sp. NPDC051758]|uniref:SAM-dependent methyltransferase n=1 Tax=Amycolatopsis sp. NPDC051758 TaxID=3363935 RepID=UPI0037B7BA53